MASNWADIAHDEHRVEPRDETHHRARVTDLAAGCPFFMLVVNMSPKGMMARCEVPLAPGDRFRIVLPLAGARVAEVRWALGGRIGCRFESPIAMEQYRPMLVTMR